jgi:hypothetical protein
VVYTPTYKQIYHGGEDRIIESRKIDLFNPSSNNLQSKPTALPSGLKLVRADDYQDENKDYTIKFIPDPNFNSKDTYSTVYTDTYLTNELKSKSKEP